MRRFKNIAATMMLAAIMTLSVSQARAGFIITLRSAEPAPVKVDDSVTVRDDLASIIKGGIMVLEGILMSD